ncbi:MAG: hypothetical protein JXB07_20015 [Anaerolineae bacterium]|nr:hypothetical protein [Anaerolineae bacterium]
MNLFQQFGLAGLLGGCVLYVLRSWHDESGAVVTQFQLSGETVLVTLPPDWVINAFLFGGLVLLALGTVWRAARREQGEQPAEGPEE